jgi:hypothetical protein
MASARQLLSYEHEDIELAFSANCSHLGFNIICIAEESGRFKIIVKGQEWADNGRSYFCGFSLL